MESIRMEPRGASVSACRRQRYVVRRPAARSRAAAAAKVKWEREHLWLFLRALGFNPRAVERSVELGVMMFNKSNIRAFHIISIFLFRKLDEFHTAKVFRLGGKCAFPVITLKAPEFRKQCHLWLEDIAKDVKSCLPKVPASFLATPAGPKFIHLMYRFARHVVVVDMKRNSVGTNIPFAESMELVHKNMYMARARCRVAYNKLLQIFQKEDFLLREYKKKEQLLIKEIKQIKSEYAVLQVQSSKMKQNENKKYKTEKIQKVRSMWTLVMEILTSLKKEKEIVDHVLEGFDGCYILDGANVVSRVPRMLACRVESNEHKHWRGNLYEAGKLNFLAVIQLLNEALRMLRDELHQYDLTSQIRYMKNISVFCTRELRNMQESRLKLREQYLAQRRGSFSKKQEDWQEKWTSFLGMCPLKLMLQWDPEFILLKKWGEEIPNPAEDEEDTVFYQRLLSVPDVCDSVRVVRCEKDDKVLETMMEKSTLPSTWISSVPLKMSKESENRDMLIEKSSHIETCKREKKLVHPKILENRKDESTTSEMLENAGDHVIQTKHPVKKDDTLKKARDDLADQVAKAVMSESPQSAEGKGMALEDTISSLAFNPFLTRKQIPRTPENLLTEIRSSWRKAIQIEGSLDKELTPAEVMTEAAPMDAKPVMKETSDSRFACSIPAPPVTDCDHLLSERRSQLSSTELGLQEQIRASHIESPILEIPGMRERERIEEQDLKSIENVFVQNVNSAEDPEEQSSQYVKKGMNTPDMCSENNSGTNVLPSDHFKGFLMDGVLNQSVAPLFSFLSQGDSHLGISDETFPEELDDMDITRLENSVFESDVIDSTDATDRPENMGDIQKSKLDLQSLFNRHKALKKIASRSEEELRETHSGGESLGGRSDRSLTPEKKRDDLYSPVELFCLDQGFTTTPSPVSLNERKYSLSSLLMTSQKLEEMASMLDKIPFDLTDKWNDQEQLNEELGTKKPSSGQHL